MDNLPQALILICGGLLCCGAAALVVVLTLASRLGGIAFLSDLAGLLGSDRDEVGGGLLDEEPGSYVERRRRELAARRSGGRATAAPTSRARSLDDVRGDYDRQFERRSRDDPEDILDEMDAFFDDAELE
jgi:hypothetical protein